MSLSNTSTEVILASATAAFSAQVFKGLWYALRKQPVNLRLLIETGGMPSSHSAMTCALATSVGLIEGFETMVFAVALGLAVIVMYDAAGLRQAAGKMAGLLNDITEDLYSNHPDRVPVKLRELLGHTPYEVIVGAFLGVAVAYAYHIRLT